MLIALCHGYATITERGDHTISCVEINFMVIGATATIALALYGLGGQTPLMEASQRIPTLAVLAGLENVQLPVVRSLLSFNVVVYLTVLIFLLAGAFFRTRFGLFVTAAGENPEALDAAGINVRQVRYLSLVAGGAICGIGGAYLSAALLAVLLLTAGCERGGRPLASGGEPAPDLTWPAAPAQARIRFVRTVTGPADLDIRPSLWERVGKLPGRPGSGDVRPAGRRGLPR